MLTVFMTAALCIGVDQLTKYLAEYALAPDGSVDVIGGILRFTYVENRGAAFGSLTDHRWVFLVLSTVLILAMIGYTVWKRPKGWLICLSLGMIIGGGIGNMIDRVALGYVVDFIDFCAFPSLWKWVFNGADAFVCVGTALLMVWILLTDSKKPAAVSDAGSAEAETELKGGTEDDKAE